MNSVKHTETVITGLTQLHTHKRKHPGTGQQKLSHDEHLPTKKSSCYARKQKLTASG